MRRHVTSTFDCRRSYGSFRNRIFLGMSRSIEWLMASVYPLMAPGMLLAFFLGLGSVEPMAQCFIQTWPSTY